jgi:hypothetical protein
MRAYNLFRRKGPSPLYCAVPEDLAVPRFVTDARWAFERKIAPGAPGPVGFDAANADDGARLNGFYLFQEV